MAFKKNDKVVMVITGGGTKSASIQTVESVKGGRVKLVDSSLAYDAKTGREIDAAIAGFSSEIIKLES